MWESCFVFGHKINLDNLGVICIPIKIEMHLMMGVILFTSKKTIAQPSMEGVWS
jgi:Ulp1 family protease